MCFSILINLPFFIFSQILPDEAVPTFQGGALPLHTQDVTPCVHDLFDEIFSAS